MRILTEIVGHLLSAVICDGSGADDDQRRAPSSASSSPTIVWAVAMGDGKKLVMVEMLSGFVLIEVPRTPLEARREHEELTTIADALLKKGIKKADAGHAHAELPGPVREAIRALEFSRVTPPSPAEDYQATKPREEPYQLPLFPLWRGHRRRAS